MAFNQTRHKISLNPKDPEDVMIARKPFASADFHGFISGKISRSVFWEYARFKHPTHQISFHTVNALRCLTFERSEHIHDGKAER